MLAHAACCGKPASAEPNLDRTTELQQAGAEIQGIAIAVWKDLFSPKSLQGNGRVWHLIQALK